VTKPTLAVAILHFVNDLSCVINHIIMIMFVWLAAVYASTL